MPTWRLAPSGDHLTCDGRDDFLLADTLWAAMHRAETERLATVLDRRRDQGFSGAMMSILPIAHDRSGQIRHPFRAGDDGNPDFGSLDEAWLEHAAEVVEMVVERGLVPVLMLQWVNYVPGTWASREAPELVMNDADTLAMVDGVVGRLREFHPIWSVSGDDTFTSDAAVARYRLIAERVRELDPEALVTAHTGGWINLPDAIAEVVDFVGYQSGHDGANWDVNPQQWNHYLDTVATRRPAMNLEPPYEGHGYGSGRGRYLAREVREASWRSVLTGAGAGLGYGAHGLWSWHRAGESFSSEGWSGMPFDAMVAAELPGAGDVGWLREQAVTHRFWELVDRSDLSVQDTSGITVGATRDLARAVVYSPHAFRFEIQLKAADYDVEGWDIVRREPVPVTTSVGGSDMLVVETPERPGEHLYVLTRR